MRIRVLTLCALAFLYGCRLGPPYIPPTAETPMAWKAPNDEAITPEINYWWEVFDDPVLNYLEEQAIVNNPNLYIAFERLLEACAIAGVNYSYLFPQITLNPSYSNIGQLFRIYLPPTGFPTLPNIPNVYRIHQMQYTMPFNLSFEVDLWGKLRGQYESAYMNAEAQAEALNVLWLSITADVAISYFQMRTFDTLMDMYSETIKVRRKGVDYSRSRYEKGIAGLIDLTSAESLYYNAEADYEDALRQRILQENTIAVLIGTPPSCFKLAHSPLHEDPPRIPAGLPSEVLLQRPDIAEAERNMAAEHALIGVAYASFFPSLQLTGTLGYLSPVFKEFMTWKSRLWAMGANVAQSIFDAGRNYENLQVTYARFREASGNYQQTVLVAFQEVEDALNNIEMEAKQSESLSKSVRATEKTFQISEQRYKNGIATYLEIVNSQETELAAKRNYINLQGLRFISTVQLIKALGGGWGCPE